MDTFIFAYVQYCGKAFEPTLLYNQMLLPFFKKVVLSNRCPTLAATLIFSPVFVPLGFKGMFSLTYESCKKKKTGT